MTAGDRVTSLGWNTHRHLELFYAVLGMGAVLHTANSRLSDDQIIYTITHAASPVLLSSAASWNSCSGSGHDWSMSAISSC